MNSLPEYDLMPLKSNIVLGIVDEDKLQSQIEEFSRLVILTDDILYQLG